MVKEEEKEPLSPVARIFQLLGLDICVINTIGFKTKINTDIIVETLKHNVSKHPRFSSILGDDGRKWIKTKVNVEDLVVVPNLNLEEIDKDGDGLVDDYVSSVAMIPLDRSKPLWDIHILKVKTSDAEAVAVIRCHHSIGDGMSLMSLLLASTRKTSDPEAFPTIPAVKRRGTTSVSQKNWLMKFIFIMCNALRMIWYTVVDVLLTLTTVAFLKDTETPLQGMDRGSYQRRFYHRDLPMDDIKLIKEAMNMVSYDLFLNQIHFNLRISNGSLIRLVFAAYKTINDVLLGVTQAAFSSYMNARYGK